MFSGSRLKIPPPGGRSAPGAPPKAAPGRIFSRFPLKIEISRVAGAIFPKSRGGPGGPLGPPGRGRDAFYQDRTFQHVVIGHLASEFEDGRPRDLSHRLRRENTVHVQILSFSPDRNRTFFRGPKRSCEMRCLDQRSERTVVGQGPRCFKHCIRSWGLHWPGHLQTFPRWGECGLSLFVQAFFI